MAKTKTTNKKKYQYFTKAIAMPDGTRKYFRATTQQKLDEKVIKAQILVNAGVDICNEGERIEMKTGCSYCIKNFPRRGLMGLLF